MSITITVVGAQGAQNDAQGKFIQYNIETKMNGEKLSLVGRSFRDFQLFDKAWRKLYPGLDGVRPPDRVFLGENSPSTVSRRIVELTIYLRGCAEIRSLRPNTAAFLIVKRALLDDMMPRSKQPTPTPSGPSAPRPKGDFTTSPMDPAKMMNKMPAKDENMQQNGQQQQPMQNNGQPLPFPLQNNGQPMEQPMQNNGPSQQMQQQQQQQQPPQQQNGFNNGQPQQMQNNFNNGPQQNGFGGPPQQMNNGPQNGFGDPPQQMNNNGSQNGFGGPPQQMDNNGPQQNGGGGADCHNCGVPNAGAPFCANCGQKQRNGSPPSGPPAFSGPRPLGAGGRQGSTDSMSRSSASSMSDSRSSQSSGGGGSPPRPGFGGPGFGNIFAQGGAPRGGFGGRPGAGGPAGGRPLPARKPTVISLGQRPPSSTGGFSGNRRGPAAGPQKDEMPPPRDFSGDLYQGNKRRRRKSFMRTYTKDHWSVADTSMVQRLFRNNGDKYAIFSDTALMYDPRFKSSKRVLMLTDNAVYLLSPGTLTSKWRLRVEDIQSVSLSTCGDHFVAIHPRNQNEPDQLILCPRKTEFLIALRFLMERNANMSLDMSFADDLALYLTPNKECYVTFREKEGRGSESINLQVLEGGQGAAISVSVPPTLIADPNRDFDEQMRMIEEAEGALYN